MQNLSGKNYRIAALLYSAVNTPPIFGGNCRIMQTPLSFFDRLLESCEVVGTPGSGFGKYGEGYFRLTAFGNMEQTEIALKRIQNNLKKLRF